MCNNESDYITLSELRNIHEWHDNKTSYVYFKEKITGQTGRKGKKFEFSWLKTNDLYLEGGESVIQTEDKDYWISAAEVSIRITDDYGKPIWREKWVTSMPCHFLILDLDVATEAENLLNKNKKNFPSLCDRITAENSMYTYESDYITVSGLRNIHEWHDSKASYVYFKEKITGQTGRKGKKFEFSWLKTNDLYLEGGESVIQTEDKDYWISAAEVSIRITDDYGKPVLREKWVTSMPCHFLILDLDVAIEAENLLNKKNFPSLCDRITAD